MTINKQDNLYDYIFHYNIYEKLWYAVKRDQLNDYFNGKIKDLPSNKDFSKLTSKFSKS